MSVGIVSTIEKMLRKMPAGDAIYEECYALPKDADEIKIVSVVKLTENRLLAIQK